MTYLLDSEKKSIAGPAFQLFREYLNYVEDVRGYIAYYAGAHDKTSGIVKPYGSFLQADEATKVAARKQPAKLGRSKKASKKATKSLS
jgi:hypothetical protein